MSNSRTPSHFPKFLICLVFWALSSVAAEDPVSGCRSAIDAYPGSPEQALDDARWCVESLEQAAQDADAKSFKDEVGDYTGGPTKQEKVLGMMSITKTYTDGSNSIEVQKMGAANTSNPLAALASFAQLGGTGRKYRIAGHTASDMSQASNVQLLVNLREGGTMNIKSSTASIEEVVAFTRLFFQ